MPDNLACALGSTNHLESSTLSPSTLTSPFLNIQESSKVVLPHPVLRPRLPVKVQVRSLIRPKQVVVVLVGLLLSAWLISSFVVFETFAGSVSVVCDAEAPKGTPNCTACQSKDASCRHIVKSLELCGVGSTSCNAGHCYGGASGSPQYCAGQGTVDLYREVPTWQGCLMLNIILISTLLLSDGFPADLVLLAGSCVAQAFGIISVLQLFAGFGNKNVIAVGMLFVLSKCVQETKALDALMKPALGSPRAIWLAQLRLCAPVLAVSAFLNNTPVVAMLIPLVSSWSRRLGMDPGKLMMPLSYCAMLGGTLTVIGSSTNLVAVSAAPEAGIMFFDSMPGGLMLGSFGILWMVLFSPWLLRSGGAIAECFPDLSLPLPASVRCGSRDSTGSRESFSDSTRSRVMTPTALASAQVMQNHLYRITFEVSG